MSKFDLVGLLKHENTQLLEELVNYRAEIANLWAKIQDLEKAQNSLKKKFEKCMASKIKSTRNGEFEFLKGKLQENKSKNHD